MENAPEQNPDEPRHFSKRFWIVLILIVILAVAVTFAIASLTPPMGVFSNIVQNL